jgi:PAS domain S-box-containing protein
LPQKSSPQKLKHNEERYQIVSDLTSDYAYAYRVEPDGELSLDWVTGALQRITGFTREEVRARGGWESLIFQEDLPIPMGQLNALYKNQSKTVEYRIIDKSGNIRWMRDLAKPVWDQKNNRLKQIFGAVQEVTESKEASMALQVSEERWKSVTHNTPNFVTILNTDHNIEYINHPVPGLRLSEVVGKPVYDFIHPKYHEIAREKIEHVFATRESCRFESEANGPDGTIAYYDNQLGPVIVTGEIVAVSIFGMDITQRKRTINALQNSESKYRLLVENANDAILIIQDERVKFFNPVALQLTGYSSKEFQDMSFKEFIHPDDRANVVDRYRKRIQGDETASTYNCRLISKSKETIWAQVNAVRTLWEHKEATLTFFRDISQLKQAESRLQHTERMESLGTLAGGIAHDFNNILSAIIGYTELSLINATQGTSLEKNLQEVYKAGTRARDLVKQILAFARQTDEEQKPIQVNVIAKEVLKLIRSTIPTTIDVKENIASHSVIRGNPSQVHQLFMNLCTNAAQAMQDTGGILTVDLTDIDLGHQPPLALSDLKTGKYIRITVSDTGPGIAPDIIDLIFNPYFTTKELGEGTGMGLALTHSIAESYGGKVTVESRLGKGAVFSIYLPVISAEGDQQSTLEEVLPIGDENILFVDDEKHITEIGRQIMEKLGYKVTVRTSSVEALELFRSKPDEFDLVITDMTMPNMTGDLLAAAIIHIRPKIPIILCTGYSKNISADSAAKIGIKAFIYKPIVKIELATVVRKILDENSI